MKVLAITQARTGSTRLPNKVLKKVGGITLLEMHVTRILKSKRIDKLVIATTDLEKDGVLSEIASELGVDCFRGSEENVLDRFYQVAVMNKPEWVVRLTSDCPLIDPKLIDEVISKAIEKNVDYCSNTINPTFPDGVDVEVFKFSVLEKAWKKAELNSDKEHVTPYILRNSSSEGEKLFTSFIFENKEDYGKVRLTVDESSDFEVINLLVGSLGIDKGWKEYADHYILTDTKELNSSILRNEGYTKSLENER